ncbi:3-oxo-tetronate kinase [uncultured Cardiobacterium sp.]|uniref:3-oxo-tetronate kinase n=1 Tax=uncultured Cardiobacterium sp. TaxID=417619 RepID=UPI00262FAF5F|nr:3-oxo-tetronate kinase [uncultured Cardiobacterium sp.]
MLQLGVIADDFTGASDIASFLTENGLRTVQMNGIPARALPDGVDAVVISLKSRSIAAQEAVAQSLSALQWLQAAGGKQFFFKYCSTFDSTAAGNIGPVTDALLDALGEDFTVISPALPVNGRTIFNGYLFVGQVLLNESGMQNHPITPMRDASLPRLMDAQARGKTGLVAYPDMVQGAAHVRDCFARLRADGYRYAVADSVDNAQLAVLAEACRDLRLVTGGSGLGAYLAALLSGGKKGDNAFVPKKGATVVLSGSCSVMTNKQVATYKAVAPHRFVEAQSCIERSEDYAAELAAWVVSHLDDKHAPLLYATVPPDELKSIQQRFGMEKSSHAIEQVFAAVAEKLRAQGVVNFICAGGETSSIVVQRLGVDGFHIGKQIAPGVPWLRVLDGEVYLALKSGNFGTEDFFAYAQGMFA